MSPAALTKAKAQVSVSNSCREQREDRVGKFSPITEQDLPSLLASLAFTGISLEGLTLLHDRNWC